MNKIISTLATTFITFGATAAEQLKEPINTTTEKINPQTEVVKEEFFYGAVGIAPLPLPIPTFGIGYSKQKDHYGLDISLDASTILVASYAKLSPKFLYYSKPNLDHEYYQGIGLAAYLAHGPFFSCIEDGHDTLFLIAPEFVWGKKYRTKKHGYNQFFQVSASWPSYIVDAKIKDSSRELDDHEHWLLLPIVSVKWGFAF